MSALGTELGARIHLGQPLRPMTDTMAFVGALDQGKPDPYSRALDAKKKDTGHEMHAMRMACSMLAAYAGTTSTRFIIFNANGQLVAQHGIEHKQHYPKPGLLCLPVPACACPCLVHPKTCVFG